MKKINQELFIAILDDDPDFAYVLSRMIEKVLGAGKVHSDFPDNAGGGYLAVVI